MLLKVGQVRELFHKAGVKRISPRALEDIDRGLQMALVEMAGDIVTIYPGRIIEAADVQRLSEVKSYELKPLAVDEDDISLEDLVAEEPLADADD